MGWKLRDSGESEGAWVEVWALLWSRVTIELSRAWEIAEADWCRVGQAYFIFPAFFFCILSFLLIYFDYMNIVIKLYD